MGDDILISLVERYEELYNLKHRHYHNQKRRDIIWDEIGTKMNESGYTCRERWTKLRENHRKALQLRRTKSGQAASKMKPPKYNKELSFLVPHLQDDKNRSTNKQKYDLSLDHTTEHSSVNSPLSPQSQSSFQCESLDYQDCSAQITTRHGRSRNFDSDPSTASVLKEYLERRDTNISDSDEKDPLIGFFINMGRTVRGFPIEEQIKLKNKIFLLVNNTELKMAMQATARETEQTTDILSQPLKIEDMSERTE
ncbi:uncharacterized protein LOC121731913 [Aricia agestis]|uniref:uncharacterized protein LOC121731913 n=1 Tax=Aricia agestis TaxID=91739 RepID=UPI001C20164D|nr:uncharacterized protein LOC121731913 [Aricia agestis]